MINKTIVALDQLSSQEIETLLPSLCDFNYFKLGLEVFNKLGKSYIQQFLNHTNQKVFLDLKLHDIPKTVYQSIKSLAPLPIEFLTIHLTGGREMIEQALEAQKIYLPNAKILGVSYLTSLGKDDFKQIYGIEEDKINDQFKRIFQLACDCKIHGVVSSPHELAMVSEVEKNSNHQLIKVTPGIRLSEHSNDDQKRVATPKQAFENGADYIVMGRAITKAKEIDKVIAQLKS